MIEWKPDKEFLDFLLEKITREFEDEGKPFNPQKVVDYVEEMRTGTLYGRNQYHGFKISGYYQKEFEAYKASK